MNRPHLNTLRIALLEMWAMALLIMVVAFLGPFGSYTQGDFLARVSRWTAMLAGAYVFIRPIILLGRWAERATHLPRGFVTLWGTVIASFPMALLWLDSTPPEMRLLGGYAGLLPFALLCALAVLAVVSWAERADARLRLYYANIEAGRPLLLSETGFSAMAQESPVLSSVPSSVPPSSDPSAREGHAESTDQPRLRARLTRAFQGEILALESEDHYVRVHGERGSELLLIRLRDAITEMDGRPGEQTHRSWWVSREAVAETVISGRTRQIRLSNGMRVPVARDSVARLQQTGFLPA